MKLPESNDKLMREILAGVEAGKIQLPNFQRPWTWDDNRIQGIILSMAQGYPMGALMLLNYGNPNIKFQCRTIEGVSGKDTVEPEQLILDGQQRITSIYQAVFSKNPVATRNDKKLNIKRYYYLDIAACMDNERFDDVSEVVISVPEDKQIKQDFNRKIVQDYSTKSNEYEHKVFPVNIIYDLTALTDWTMGYLQYYDSDENAKELFYEFQKSVIVNIQSYKLPVITLDKETPRDAVCKVFENVNTGGVALTVFELVTAIYAMDNFNLQEDWDRIEDELRNYKKDDESIQIETDLFDDISATDFLTAVCLYTTYKKKIANGGKSAVSCKKRDILKLSFSDYYNNREQVKEGFKLAKVFLLERQNIVCKKDLPYTTQLIPLSAICAYIGKSACEDADTINTISKWYWCGVFGEMYGGANETRFANDIEDVVAKIKGIADCQERTVNSATFSAVRLLTLQTRNSAAYKGVICLLHKTGCVDLMHPVGLGTHKLFGSTDIHHIFPESYCKKQDDKQLYDRQKYNSIVNKTPIFATTNRKIGGNAPSVYVNTILRDVKNLQEYSPVKDIDGVSEKDYTIDSLEARFATHQVRYDYLKANAFKEYFVDRAKKLLCLIDDAMGKKISDRDSEETKKQYFGMSLK